MKYYNFYYNPAQNELKKIPEKEFYSKLERDVQVNHDIDRHLHNCNECSSSNLIKEYASKLVRNYDDLKAHLDEKSNNKYCRFFVYWLYTAKVKFPKTFPDLRKKWDSCIPCVWENLENNAGNHKGKCDFKNEDISFAFVKVKKALDEICSIKDILKNDEENPDTKNCLEINSIKKYYLDYLLSNIGSISSTNSWKDEYFKIDDDCSLGKIYNFLQEKQCPPEEIAQRMEVKQCQAAAPETKLDCTKASCPNLKELCQENYPTQTCNNLDELCKERCTSQQLHNLNQLCPTYCDEHRNDPVPTSEERLEDTSKMPHLQLPVTVFSSVVGTIFFFLFLYKFTPFRSWFLNRIGSKQTLKHKIKQDMEREFLAAPFQPPYRDDQNSRPRVGYSQN